MDSHDKEFFDRLMELTEENNLMLKKIRRAAKIVGIWRIVYWTILIGVSIGAYYYVKPYVDQLIGVYTGLEQGVNSFQRIVNPFDNQ